MSSTRQKTAPKYCLHKPSGRAYLRIRGRVRYLGAYGSPESLETYGRLVAELAAQPAPGSSTGDSRSTSPTVVELADAYWEFCKGYYRKKDGTPSEWLDYIHPVLTDHLAQLYGRTPAEEFGPKSFKAIRQRLVDGHKSRTYINKIMGVIARCFKWGVSEELIPPSVYHGLSSVDGLRKGRSDAREPSPILPVEATLVEATLPYLPAVVADMVRFQRLTGCRPGEVCQLRPMDLDRSGEVWKYSPEFHKTEYRGRERVVYVGPKAQAIIAPYLLRAPEAYCFDPSESETKRRAAMRENRKSKVTPSQRRRHKPHPRRTPATCYTSHSYMHAIRKAVDKANRAIVADAEEFQIEKPVLLPHWCPNRLRHARATEIRERYGLEQAQVCLGHSRADTTQIYAERNENLAIGVMKEIG